MSGDNAWQRYVAEAMTATVKGPLTRSMAAHVLAMHLAHALGGDPGKDNSSVLYPLCSRLVATLGDQGYVLHGELPRVGPADTGRDREPTACPSCGYTGEHILTFFGVQRSCLLTCGRHGCGFEWWEPKAEWSPEQQSEEMGEQQ